MTERKTSFQAMPHMRIGTQQTRPRRPTDSMPCWIQCIDVSRRVSQSVHGVRKQDSARNSLAERTYRPKGCIPHTCAVVRVAGVIHVVDNNSNGRVRKCIRRSCKRLKIPFPTQRRLTRAPRHCKSYRIRRNDLRYGSSGGTHTRLYPFKYGHTTLSGKTAVTRFVPMNIFSC